VEGDAMRLTQVLWNLLRNAVKFTHPDGSIRVRLKDGPLHGGAPTVQVEVADSGIGIDPLDIGRIFDAFDQGNREVTRQFGGLGLGLAISKAISDLHGGTLSAFSKGRGQGAVFTLTLPVACSRPVPEMVLPVCKPAGQGQEADRAVKKGLDILLVEDHHDTCEVLSQLLTRRGHRVTVANSLESAMRVMTGGQKVDIMISDLGLPDGTGVELMEKVRALNPVRAIALSGYGMEEDIRRSKAAGFEAHLVKPVNFSDLQKAIDQLRN
ncbi:MAG TPA: ATP-binding protein, partial [Verrucomicrobium sp.]|nr:ATP-binding protein [Verrucomicrobium sp.]